MVTNEEKSHRIAKFCGKDNLFVLKKRGLYYRPGAGGYTDRISEAWVLTEDEANKHVYPYDEPVTKHPAPLPDYFNDWNAIFDAKKQLTLGQGFRFGRAICDMLGIEGFGDYAVFEISSADLEKQVEAFGLACELWK